MNPSAGVIRWLTGPGYLDETTGIESAQGYLGPWRIETAIGPVSYETPMLLVHLARKIRPRLVISLGLGAQTVIETGAINHKNLSYPQFDHLGRRQQDTSATDHHTKPRYAAIDTDHDASAARTLPWFGTDPGLTTKQAQMRLKRGLGHLPGWQIRADRGFADRGFHEPKLMTAGTINEDHPLGPVHIAPGARAENDYICNATAWSMAGLAGDTAGSMQEIEASGFIHLAPMVPGRTAAQGYFSAAANLILDVARTVLA